MESLILISSLKPGLDSRNTPLLAASFPYRTDFLLCLINISESDNDALHFKVDLVAPRSSDSRSSGGNSVVYAMHDDLKIGFSQV